MELGAASATWDADGSSCVHLLLHEEDEAWLQTLAATAPLPSFEVLEAAAVFDPDDWEAAAADTGFAPFLERPLWVAPVQSAQLPPASGANIWTAVVPFMALFAVETVCWFLTTLAGCATLGGRQGSMKFA